MNQKLKNINTPVIVTKMKISKRTKSNILNGQFRDKTGEHQRLSQYSLQSENMADINFLPGVHAKKKID